MLDKVMRERFEAALKADDLRTLALALQAQGQSQVAIYHLFCSFWGGLYVTDRKADAVIIDEALNSISGLGPLTPTLCGSAYLSMWNKSESISSRSRERAERGQVTVISSHSGRG